MRNDEINNTVSVIVPVYKVEAYLDDCVVSLLEQTYQDLEIILVDDGSPDSCGDICDRWAEKDSRIKVVHKENGGLSDARNAGLKHAHGEYVYFVDSDDRITRNAIQSAVEYSKMYDADIVISTMRRTQNSGEVKIASGNELFQEMFLRYFWEAWGKLYKRTLIAERNFPKGKLYEDIAYTPYVILDAKTVVHMDDGAYLYTVREDSIMGKAKTVIKADLVENIEELLAYLKKNYKMQSQFFLNWSILFLAHKVLSLDDMTINENFKKGVREYYKKHIFNVLFHNCGMRGRFIILKAFWRVR